MIIPYWKNKALEIYISKKYDWHTGIATIVIWKLFKTPEYDDEWYSNWWTFIPILGKTKKNI